MTPWLLLESSVSASGKAIAAALQHQDTIASITFSPDGTRIVTASDDNTAQVWDAVSGQPLAASLEHEVPIVSAAFSPDGTRVVAVGINTMRIWETPLDYTAPDRWAALTALSPFILIGSTHHRRTSNAP